MTERKAATSTFKQNIDHMDLPASEYSVFKSAASFINNEVDAVQAIFAAGGNRQHINEFSRQICSSKPVLPWCDGKEPSEIVEALLQCAVQVQS